MKILFLSVLFWFFQSGLVAQIVQANQQSGQMILQPYNGSLVLQRVPGQQPVKGSPFLLDSPEPVSFFKEGLRYDNPVANIDLATGLVIYEISKKLYYSNLEAIDSLFLDHEIYLIWNSELYRKLEEGTYSLFEKLFVQFKKADYNLQFDQGNKFDQWHRFNVLYVKYNQQLYQVKKLKDFKEFLPESGYRELKNYLKDSGIQDFNTHSVQDLLKYLNSVE